MKTLIFSILYTLNLWSVSNYDIEFKSGLMYEVPMYSYGYNYAVIRIDTICSNYEVSLMKVIDEYGNDVKTNKSRIRAYKTINKVISDIEKYK